MYSNLEVLKISPLIYYKINYIIMLIIFDLLNYLYMGDYSVPDRTIIWLDLTRVIFIIIII